MGICVLGEADHGKRWDILNLDLAEHVDISRHQKSRHDPKKKPLRKTGDPNGGDVAAKIPGLVPAKSP